MGSAGHRRRAPAGAGRRRQPAGGRQRHRSRARAESSGGAGQALSAAGGVNRFPVGAAPVASFSGIAGGDQELAAEAAPARAFRDRKSVVSGKSVSVRVDLGGRRIIKKKIRREIAKQK